MDHDSRGGNGAIVEDVMMPPPAHCDALSAQTGRRSLLAWSMGLAALSASVFALGTRSGGGVIVAAACLFKATSTAGWNVLEIVSTEAFPTHARASGVSVVSATGRLGSIAAQFANGYLEEMIPVLLLLTSGLTLVGGLAAMLLPRDTRGKSLEEEA